MNAEKDRLQLLEFYKNMQRAGSIHLDQGARLLIQAGKLVLNALDTESELISAKRRIIELEKQLIDYGRFAAYKTEFDKLQQRLKNMDKAPKWRKWLMKSWMK